MEWPPPGLSVCLPLLILPNTTKENVFFWHQLTRVVPENGRKTVVVWLWFAGVGRRRLLGSTVVAGDVVRRSCARVGDRCGGCCAEARGGEGRRRLATADWLSAPAISRRPQRATTSPAARLRSPADDARDTVVVVSRSTQIFQQGRRHRCKNVV